MIYSYQITQAGDTVTIKGDDDAALREKAHRIARKSLTIDSDPVTIRRQTYGGIWRSIAVLNTAEPKRIRKPSSEAYEVKGVKPVLWGNGGINERD